MIKFTGLTHLILSWGLLLTNLPAAGSENDNVNDAKSNTGLAYDLVGEGSLVVLIHGSNLDRRLWNNEVAYLQDSAQVLRYDLRGLGNSDTAVEPYSDHADLLALMDELGQQEASLVGLSAGVQVALDTALMAPDRITKLVLVSPSLNEYSDEDEPDYLNDLIQALRIGNLNLANEVMLRSGLMRVPEIYSTLVRTMVGESRQWQMPYQLIRPSPRPVLENLEAIEIPTLILTGANDYTTIENLAMLLRNRMPNAEKSVLADGSHLLNLTSPEIFRQLLSSFLALSDQ